MQTDLLIVGAGPAGLAHAFWRLQAQPDLRVKIVDQQPQPGGWVQTRRIEGYSCEVGPQALRPTAVSDDLVQALNLQDQIVPAQSTASMRYIGRGGKLLALPNGPGSLLKSPLFGLFGVLSLLAEPLRRSKSPERESMAAFLGRRLGKRTIPLAEAMASGVYGGDAHNLEMAAAFPAMVKMEHEHGSLLSAMLHRRKEKKGKPPEPKRPAMHTFTSGMESMIQALRQQLQDSLILGREVTAIDKNAAKNTDGWSVTLGGEAESQWQTQELVLALPACRAATLLRPTDAALADDLQDIPFASLANVYLGFNEADVQEQLKGFGFLLDRGEESPVLGAIYCSSIFPDRCVPGKFLLRMMVGGARYPDIVGMEDQEIADLATETLRRYTGVQAPLQFQRVIKVRQAIPQYVLGHCERMQRIRQRQEAHAGLSLIGNSYDEISVTAQLGKPSPTP